MQLTIRLFALSIAVIPLTVSAQGVNTGSTATSAFGTGSRTLGQGISSPLGTGQTGSPGSMVESLNTSAGQVTGNERFIQENRQPGAFVGADTGEVGTGNVFSQQGAGGQAGGGQRGPAAGGLRGGQFGNQFSQFNFNQPGQGGRGGGLQQTQRRTLRTPLRVAFEVPVRTATSPLTGFQARLSRSPLVPTGNVTVSFEGRTAVLRGSIESQAKRDLLTRIAHMEPGVSDVRNELVVQASAVPQNTLPALSLPRAR